MEPKSPGGAMSPELQPVLPSVEISPESQPSEPVESGPAPQEVDRTGAEGANQNQGMTLPAPIPQPITPDPVINDDDSTKLPTATIDSPEVANDVDLVEKEWVEKAKEIVHRTIDDPHQQNYQVSLLKADYMKKRYGKDVKVPEDKSSKV
jgi:hypothetical protein